MVSNETPRGPLPVVIATTLGPPILCRLTFDPLIPKRRLNELERRSEYFVNGTTPTDMSVTSFDVIGDFPLRPRNT